MKVKKSMRGPRQSVDAKYKSEIRSRTSHTISKTIQHTSYLALYSCKRYECGYVFDFDLQDDLRLRHYATCQVPNQPPVISTQTMVSTTAVQLQLPSSCCPALRLYPTEPALLPCSAPRCPASSLPKARPGAPPWPAIDYLPTHGGRVHASPCFPPDPRIG